MRDAEEGSSLEEVSKASRGNKSGEETRKLSAG